MNFTSFKCSVHAASSTESPRGLYSSFKFPFATYWGFGFNSSTCHRTKAVSELPYVMCKLVASILSPTTVKGRQQYFSEKCISPQPSSALTEVLSQAYPDS